MILVDKAWVISRSVLFKPNSVAKHFTVLGNILRLTVRDLVYFVLPRSGHLNSQTLIAQTTRIAMLAEQALKGKDLRNSRH
mmetsp:Transcript_9975/g.18126  ORF Transcript_9975/g.18126 Transcript_9975/m.18126 type:complete len:81 (+) Transcript_9975:786-1028(+)